MGAVASIGLLSSAWLGLSFHSGLRFVSHLLLCVGLLVCRLVFAADFS